MIKKAITFISVSFIVLSNLSSIDTPKENNKGSEVTTSQSNATASLPIPAPLPSGTLDFTKVVGSIAGGAGVSSSGAATYSIPINVPKGTNGMEPKIGISYNSQGGNGLLGVGWNLNGISAIMATGRNFYYDGVRAPISATDSECRLVWNGQRIIATSGVGFAGTEFKTEVYSNNKITKSGSGQTAYFKVYTEDGITLEYGSSVNSRLHLTSTIEWMWLLTKAYDRYGNTIKYTYSTESAKKRILLTKIEYGGNVNSLVNEINFVYVDRSDIQYSYILNNLIVRDKVLDQITIFSNDTLINKYKFNYSTSDETLLNEIVQYDKDNNQYNPTTIILPES